MIKKGGNVVKRFAILLGCEEYKDSKNYSEISYCHDDVTLLEQTLIDYCGYAKQDIYCELLNIYENRDPEYILNKIKELLEKSEQGDTILFYYAGHGDNVNGESYLVLPYTKRESISQTGLPLRDISDSLRKNNRINVRIFDCCHSGQDVRSAIDKSGSKTFIQDIVNNNSNSSGWVTLASCGEDEYSYPDNSFNHGVFTYYLVESIKEFNEEEEIYPEILKLKVFEKVSKWSLENGKNQNPIFNAAISGNISIGIRKKKSETLKLHLPNTPESINVDSQLIDRINAMRGRRKSDDEESKEIFNKYILKIHERLIANKEKIIKYNLSLIETTPIRTEAIPYNIKPAIVKLFKSKNHDTFFKYKIENEYSKDTRPSYMKNPFNEFEPKLLSINYVIEQDLRFPESYTELALETDGYLPQAKIFVHLSPLQLTVCIVSGISIKGNTQLFNSIFIKASDEINDGFINDFVTDLIGKFNIEYKNSVERVIKYYESEIKLTDNK